MSHKGRRFYFGNPKILSLDFAEICVGNFFTKALDFGK